jgi:hypothetical protein
MKKKGKEIRTFLNCFKGTKKKILPFFLFFSHIFKQEHIKNKKIEFEGYITKEEF